MRLPSSFAKRALGGRLGWERGHDRGGVSKELNTGLLIPRGPVLRTNWDMRLALERSIGIVGNAK